MRQIFVQVASYNTAKRRAPWAAKIVRVEGGFIAFECLSDWDTWRNQI